MLTIATCGLKGGIGKSTITVQLASAFHAAGHRTLIVDADDQASCATWAARAAELGRSGPPVVSIAGKTLRRDLAQVSAGFDVVCIDTAARLAQEARAAMLVADLVLLPVSPSGADFWALTETVAVLDEAKTFRPELAARIVLNRAGKTVMTREVAKSLESLAVSVLDVTLGNRQAFVASFTVGQGVGDYEPNGAAAHECRRLIRAVLAALQPQEVAA